MVRGWKPIAPPSSKRLHGGNFVWIKGEGGRLKTVGGLVS